MRVMPRSIRQRVLYTMLIVVLLSGIGFLLVLNAVVRRSFTELETAAMTRDAARVHSAIDASAQWLEAVSGDWARWTDTYEFLAGTRPNYPDVNLDAASMDVLGVDFMAYIDSSGKMYHISTLNPETRRPIDPPRELIRRLEDLNSAVFATSESQTPKSGHVMLPGGPASIVFEGITTSDGSAPSNGVLVVGVYFRESEIAAIERMTALNVELGAPQTQNPSSGSPMRLDAAYIETDGGKILARSTLQGVDGRPALTYTVREPRATMAKAGSTVHLVGLGMLGVVVLSSLTMVVTLDRMVNRRLTRMHDELSSLPGHSMGDRRVTVEGDDEISDIAVALNTNFEGLAEAQAALRHAADHDYLTGLANRRRFEKDVEKALAEMDRKGGMLAWVLMDLDGFKAINDSMGHHCGDMVLSWFAHLLVSEVRRYSTIARLGGDEFAILLPHSDEYDAAVVADRLLTALASVPCDACDSGSFHLNASVGIAVAPKDGKSVGELSRAADYAMYHTKIARVHDAELAH